MDKLFLVKIDYKYCNYLRKFDNKVPYNMDKKELRPFIGVLFEINKCKYFAPLSSPKEKHKTMRSSIDFLKIDNGNLGAINFNNMIPVADGNIIDLDLDDKPKNKKELKYYKLLTEQLFWLNRNHTKVFLRSRNLYNKYKNKDLNKNIIKRCCNFPLLEEKCKEYNNIKQKV